MDQYRYRKTDVFGERRDGHWIGCSSTDFVRLVNEISLGLLELGVCKGDKIGIMSANRPEWNFVDFGTMQIGAVTVPLYPNISSHDLEFVLGDAGIRVLFIGNKELYKRIRSVQERIPDIRIRSEERRVGKESVSTCRSGWAQ